MAQPKPLSDKDKRDLIACFDDTDWDYEVHTRIVHNVEKGWRVEWDVYDSMAGGHSSADGFWCATLSAAIKSAQRHF